jgi:hypothetical protein
MKVQSFLTGRPHFDCRIALAIDAPMPFRARESFPSAAPVADKNLCSPAHSWINHRCCSFSDQVRSSRADRDLLLDQSPQK